MMAHGLQVFVEGKADEEFIRCMLQHIGHPEADVMGIGNGVSSLPRVSNEIRKAHDAGKRVAAVLDADCSFEERCSEFRKTKDEHGLPIDDFFLMPNHRDPGCLDTLLRDIAPSPHKAIYGCLDQYEACLRRLDPVYAPVPVKGQVYAYCEAVGVGPKSEKRAYTDRNYWDLDAPAVTPLKDFLVRISDPCWRPG